MKKEKKERPLISVIMPVYNTKESFLRESIESILNQTYKKFELIIVDDCSTKPIRDIVSSYHDSRIQFYQLLENQGASQARNTGINRASGKYIAVQDSDDISRPNRLQAQVLYMESHPDVGVLGGAYSVFPQSKEQVITKFGSDDYLNTFALLKASPFGHSTVMIRKSVLDETGIRYDPTAKCDDFKLWMDLLDKTKFMNLPKVLVDYRWHGDNTSNQNKEELAIEIAQTRVNAWLETMNADEKHADLLKRFLAGQPLDSMELRKAIHITSNLLDVCKKKFPTPRFHDLVRSLFEGLVENAKTQNSFDKNTLEALWINIVVHKNTTRRVHLSIKRLMQKKQRELSYNL